MASSREFYSPPTSVSIDPMNNSKKPKIALIFGGPSMESPISCISAQSIWKNIDRDKFEPIAIAWANNRKFYASDNIESLILNPNDPNLAEINISNSTPVQLEDLNLDGAFNIVHGHEGEDGVLQGKLTSLGIRCVGSGVLGSAISFHKDICKRILQSHGLPVVPWVSISRGQIFPENMNIDFPVFVKPAAGGSSVAVSKVKHADELIEAMETAFVECKDILIEQGLKARELECAFMLGEASGVGEIIPNHEFYSWEAKYIDPNGARIQIKADIPDALKEDIRQMSIDACTALKIKGLARCDFFYDEENKQLFINEINTLPGFTAISMFPQLWEDAGVSFKEQVSKLIFSILPGQSIAIG